MLVRICAIEGQKLKQAKSIYPIHGTRTNV